MGKKGTILSLLLVPLILSTVILVIFLSNQRQSSNTIAQAVPSPSGSCQTPSAVSNVKVNFPHCDNSTCSFTKADCTWSAVSGATNYTVKVTQVESGQVVQNNTVAAATTQVIFDIVANKTYRCDISAVNSCGQSGPTGTDSLLCKVDQTFTPTPSPTPLPSPSPTTPPTTTPPSPSPSPSPTPLSCGAATCDVNGCQQGLVCMQTTTGQFVCGMPQFQTACQQSPSLNSCCAAPNVTITPSQKPQPTLLPSGNPSPMAILGIGSLFVTILGGAAFLLL